MNRIKSITNPLMWFMAILLAAFVAGCGGGNGTQVSQASSAKAITAFSLAAASGVPASTRTDITEGTTPKTIAVTMPNGTTDLTALVATFTAPGASVKVGTTTQVTGKTPNNFTLPRVYTVTAADGSSVTYTVTVTVAAAGATAAVDLLSILTNNFVILAQANITEAVPASGVIAGNIGLSPATGANITVLCSEMQGASGVSAIHAIDAGYRAAGYAACAVDASPVVAQAVLDMGKAYTAASDPATPAGVGANLNVLGGVIPAGHVFAPGTYTWGSGVSINGDITLTGSASDVWIFQMSGVLTTASGSAPSGGAHVIVGGSAQASNVFWRVGGASATLGTYSTFTGNILGSSSTLIAIQNGAVLHGRALAGSNVTLSGNTVGP